MWDKDQSKLLCLFGWVGGRYEHFLGSPKSQVFRERALLYRLLYNKSLLQTQVATRWRSFGFGA
jgi:hypothetical protein